MQGNSLAVQWSGLWAFTAGAWVWSWLGNSDLPSQKWIKNKIPAMQILALLGKLFLIQWEFIFSKICHLVVSRELQSGYNLRRNKTNWLAPGSVLAARGLGCSQRWLAALTHSCSAIWKPLYCHILLQPSLFSLALSQPRYGSFTS